MRTLSLTDVHEILDGMRFQEDLALHSWGTATVISRRSDHISVLDYRAVPKQ
jgi:hypothetical protein